MTKRASPFVVIIAGPNGSGKSTLTRQLVASGVDFGEYINPDEIAATLTGDYNSRVRMAQGIADERRANAVRDRRSFSFETVMSHPSKLGLLREAKTVGFHVQMYFVATNNPLTNITRVANRVAKGGHDVPTDKIVERYARTLSLLPEALRICDAAVLFDNSGTAIVPWLELMRDGEGVIVTERDPAGTNAKPGWIPSIAQVLGRDGAMKLVGSTLVTRWAAISD